MLQSCPTLCDPIDGSLPGFPSLGFSRQEHWSGLPFPSPVHKSESEVAQSCPTLHDHMDCSLPGSSVHGIFHARVLEWGAIAFSNNILGRRKGCLTRKSCWFHFQGISLIGSPHPLHCIPLDHCSNFLPVLRFYLLPLALLCTVLFTEHAARVAPLLSTLHLCMHAQSCLTLQPHGL